MLRAPKKSPNEAVPLLRMASLPPTSRRSSSEKGRRDSSSSEEKGQLFERKRNSQSEKKKSCPPEGEGKGNVMPESVFSVLQRKRDPLTLLPTLEPLAKDYREKYLSNPPLEDKFREYDIYQYQYTDLMGNYDQFQKRKNDCEKELNRTARLQSAVDVFDKSIYKPFFLDKKPVSSVPLAAEEKKAYLLSYLSDQLSEQEAKLFENQLLSDLNYIESVYLKTPMPLESSVLTRKHELSISPALDPRNAYGHVTSHYEGMAWLMVMLTGFFGFMSILSRKEK
jgi:hypothetical protein